MPVCYAAPSKGLEKLCKWGLCLLPREESLEMLFDITNGIGFPVSCQQSTQSASTWSAEDIAGTD